jgi:hypothetical protein
MDNEKLIPFMRYNEALKGAVESGNSGLLQLVLEKILESDEDLHDVQVGDLSILDGMTLAQYVAKAGKDDLFQWVANCGYGCSDINTMAAARKLVASKAAMNTQETYFKIVALVHMLRDKHRLTGRYYVMLHLYLIYGPGLIISTAAAILSFVSTAKQIDQYSASSIVLCVGALSIVTALLQTVSDQLQLSGKGLQHTSAADELSKILNNLEFGYTSGDELLSIKDQVCELFVSLLISTVGLCSLRDLSWDSNAVSFRIVRTDPEHRQDLQVPDAHHHGGPLRRAGGRDVRVARAG